MGKPKAPKRDGPPRITPGAIMLSPQQARDLRGKDWEHVTDEERLRILNASADAKPVANARNPRHIDDLLPPENGYRVKGLWKKSVDAVIAAELPQHSAPRDIHATPAGLTNMGNTCFVNSALQVLFTNLLFRHSIYQLEDEVINADEKGILAELRKLFIDMQFGEESKADPNAFLNVLGLQGSEQQDAQEFQKLLMQELERSMSRSQDPNV